MKRTNLTILILASLLAVAKAAYSAMDTSNISISFAHVEYVLLTGTVVNATKMFAEEDIKPAGNWGPGPTVSVGTLGIESNMPGNCTLEFTTLNQFQLRHTVSNRRLTRYSLSYEGNNITANSDPIIQPCNVTPSSLDFTAEGRYRRRVDNGIYRDVVTITVTTE